MPSQNKYKREDKQFQARAIGSELSIVDDLTAYEYYRGFDSAFAVHYVLEDRDTHTMAWIDLPATILTSFSRERVKALIAKAIFIDILSLSHPLLIGRIKDPASITENIKRVDLDTWVRIYDNQTWKNFENKGICCDWISRFFWFLPVMQSYSVVDADRLKALSEFDKLITGEIK